MNALYLILIALGFSVGVIMSSMHEEDQTQINIVEEIEAEPEIEDMNCNTEAETRTFYFLN